MNKQQLKDISLRFFFSWSWLFLILLVLDHVTKRLAHDYSWNMTLIPGFFHFTLHYNTGAAWSMLAGNLDLLAFISAAVGIGLIVYRVHQRNKLTSLKKAIIAVILAGTWGNFIDRAFNPLLIGKEGVVDFIHFQFGSYHFPVFNIADICLTLGIIGYALLVVIEDEVAKRKQKEVPIIENSEEKANEEENL